MRRVFLPALLAAGLTAGSAWSEEPKLPASAAAPTVALASAADADGKVTIKLRVYDSIPATESRKTTVYETVTETVDGKVVTKQVPVEKIVSVTIMKPIRWREIKVMAGDPGVEVRDLAGKEVPAKKLATLLEKETAVLLSTAGPVDPFHLQLAKEGTLVVIAPMESAGPAPIGVGVGPPGLPPRPAAIPGVATPPPPLPPPPLPPKVNPKQ
jgi:hypothetical protein